MRPLVFNVHKPEGVTSYDVIRHFKRNLPQGFGKIGHFGTLDPFCSGVLLVAVAGASRLNDYIHQYFSKTYLARGELGISTLTGDMTSPVNQKDDSQFFQDLRQLDRNSLEGLLQGAFCGEYLQSPPAFSAAKYQGKSLYEWARKGILVTKDPKERFVSQLEVVEWDFPFLTLKIKVSSGTYIRTLFEDCAKKLGTIGVLHTLKRLEVGPILVKDSLEKKDWPYGGKTLTGEDWNPEQFGLTLEQVFPLPLIILDQVQAQNFLQGKKVSKQDLHEKKANPYSALSQDLLPKDKFWMCNQANQVIGLGKIQDHSWVPVMNFPLCH